MPTPAGLIHKHRQYVSELLARGKTQVEIYEILQSPFIDGERNPRYLVSPETDEPFSHSTIHRDCQAIIDEWRAATIENADEMLGREVATILAARRIAWESGDYVEIRKSAEALAKLLGLHRPQRVEHRHDADQFEQIQEHRSALLDDLKGMMQRMAQTQALEAAEDNS